MHFLSCFLRFPQSGGVSVAGTFAELMQTVMMQMLSSPLLLQTRRLS